MTPSDRATASRDPATRRPGAAEWADLVARLERARPAADAVEGEVRELREQLDTMRQSPARRAARLMLRLIMLPIRLVLRPVDTSTWIATKVGAWRPVAAMRAGIERFTVRRSPLQGIQFDARHGTEHGARWMGPVTLAGRSRNTLCAAPPVEVRWTLTPTPGARVAVDCALLPSAWDDWDAGVQFEVIVEAPGGTTRRKVVVRPGRHWSDRRWRRIAIPLGAAPSALLTLAATVADGGGVTGVWAAWGEPRLEIRRPVPELLRSLGAAVRALGLAGAIRRALAYQPLDSEQSRYVRWCARHTPDAAALAALGSRVGSLPVQPLVSVITPVWNTEPRYLRACYESLRAQAYSRWEWCVADDASTSPETRALLDEIAADPRVRLTRLAENGHICVASNAALALASGEYVALLDHDDELAPEALAEVVSAINEHPAADFLYSDEDKLDLAGQRCDPFFKPDWSPDFFRTCMYTCHLMVLRRSLVLSLGGFRPGYEGAQDYDLALRVMERTAAIHHVPKVLYHWRKLPESTASSGQAKPWALAAARRAMESHVERARLGAEVLDGAVPGLFRIRYAIPGTARVSVVIPTDGRVRDVDGRRVDLVANAISSIVARSTYRALDLVVADNGRLSAEAERLMREVGARRVTYRLVGPFNFAHKLNFAARHATGDHLVIFNDDLEVITPEWIEAMLEFSAQPRIGAVGARLLYPDGRLQHVGMVLGVCGVAAHAWHALPGDTPGYASSAIAIRNYSAVTGACMMTRREAFESVGGFDERLAIDFNDVDYCLRLGARGLLVVYTPYAQLYHHESGTLGNRVQHPRELALMLERWGTILARDPYYSEHLTRDFPDFRLDA